MVFHRGSVDDSRGGAPSPGLTRLANVLLWTAIAGCSVIFVLALPGLAGGASADQVVLYVVVPAAGVGALLLVARSRPARRISAVLALTGVVTALLFAEAAIMIGPTALRGLAIDAWDLEAADGSLRDIVLDLREGGRSAYARMPGSVLVDMDQALTIGTSRVHPITPAPGGTTVVLCNDLGSPVVYEADRYGFRNRDSLWDEGATQVALVGDSYTHGACVDEHGHIAAYLNQRWNTLNTGVSGAGPLQELAILREYVAGARPAVVVWVMFEGNDLWDLEQETRRTWLTRYLDPSHGQRLRAAQDRIDVAYAAFLDSLIAAADGPRAGAGEADVLSRVMAVPRLGSLRRLLGLRTSFPRSSSRAGLLPEVLDAARREVEAWGGTLLVAFLPAYERYQGPLSGLSTGAKPEIVDAVAQAGLVLVDLDSAFLARGDPRTLWAHPRGHLSPAGYEAVATELGVAIENALDSGS